MESFIFNQSDFHFKINCHEAESRFDRRLMSNWNEKMDSGKVFWYRLSIPCERMVDKFLLQLNPNRSNFRRPPSNIQLINQPFNAEGFNFNKVKEEEKLFNLKHEDDTVENSNNVIMVNVSPLEHCHVLLVPNPEKCLPQFLTEESLNLAVQLCLLSDSSYFRVAFNSLGAYASVNHLHFHGYYLKREMYLEFCPVDNVNGLCFSIKNYPAKGFAFQIRDKNEIKPVVKNLYKLIEFLQHENIPHNLFITHGKSFESVEASNLDELRDCLRIYVWARKPSWGTKELSAFNIAVCELFGHMVIKNENDYESLTNEEITTTLNDLTAEPFEQVLSNVVKIF